MFLSLDHWLVLIGIGFSMFPNVRGQLHLMFELSLMGIFNSLFFNILFIFWRFGGRFSLINGLGRLLCMRVLALL